MAADIVCLTAYFRPEFLFLCLENIYNARGQETKEIRIYHDVKDGDFQRFEKELVETHVVLNHWKPKFGGCLHPYLRAPNEYYGNTYNVLEAYKAAYQSKAERVYLIEDDVLVTPDFFEWHERAQQQDYFATVAGSTWRNDFCIPVSQQSYDSENYASLGVCWPRENLKSIVEYANPEFYWNTGFHIARQFPNSKLGLKYVEQDGLIQRIAEQQFLKFGYANPPRAFHVGLWGYHRSIGESAPTGTFWQRVDKLRELVRNADWIKSVSGSQSDIQAFPSNTAPALAAACNTLETKQESSQQWKFPD